MLEEQLIKSQFEKQIQAGFAGAATGVVMNLSVHHPLDCVKTRAQSGPQITNIFDVVRNTYREAGIKGFYAGAGMGAAGAAVKQGYRFPLMVSLPDLFKKLFNGEEYPILQKGLTGLTIASIESLLIAPFEKSKVWLMTKSVASQDNDQDPNKSKNKKTFKMLMSNLAEHLKTVVKELNIVYPRQIVGWSGFLMADEGLRHMARTHHQSNELPFTTVTGVSVGVAVITTTITMPFDKVKTLIQKEYPWPNKGLYTNMKDAHRAYGMRGLYTGWQLYLAQGLVHAFFTVNILNALEESNNQKELASEVPSLRPMLN